VNVRFSATLNLNYTLLNRLSLTAEKLQR